MFKGVVANMFNSMFMSKTIYNWVYSSLTGKIEGISEAVDFVQIYEEAPQFYSDILAFFDLNFSEFEKAIADLGHHNVADVTEMIANPLANMLSTFIAVIAIFIISMIVLYFIVKLLNNITKIKIIGVINSILGIALGVLLASVIVWGLSFVLEILIESIGPMYPEIINDSLTKDSMIINALKEAGLLDMFNGLKEQITESIS